MTFLCDTRPYPLIKQQKITVATTALHNFIQMCGVEDEEFSKCDKNIYIYIYIECGEERNPDEEMSLCNPRRVVDGACMNGVQNQIAIVLMKNMNNIDFFYKRNNLLICYSSFKYY